MSNLLMIQDLTDYIGQQSKQFNGLKTVQDRKYLVYQLFKNVNGFENNYNITKYVGSNQIVLTYGGAEIYNSDNDSYTVNSFKIFLHKLLTDYILRRDK